LEIESSKYDYNQLLKNGCFNLNIQKSQKNASLFSDRSNQIIAKINF